MAPTRRRVLQSIGATEAASAITVGPVLAQEDGSECPETVETYTRTGGNAGPLLIGGGVVISSTTEPFTISGGAIAASELPENRIKVTMTWNPTDSGPNSANAFLDQQTTSGEWETIGYGQGEGSTPGGNPQNQNRVEFAVADGDQYQGTDGDTTTPEADNTAIIAANRTYRVRPQSEFGVANNEITIEIQSFEPSCVSEES
jgi:hypothetical protein